MFSREKTLTAIFFIGGESTDVITKIKLIFPPRVRYRRCRERIWNTTSVVQAVVSRECSLRVRTRVRASPFSGCIGLLEIPAGRTRKPYLVVTLIVIRNYHRQAAIVRVIREIYGDERRGEKRYARFIYLPSDYLKSSKRQHCFATFSLPAAGSLYHDSKRESRASVSLLATS